MLELTEEQKIFLAHHKIPLSAVFDASGLGKKEYHDTMKALDKYIAIGVTPCKSMNHTLRTRSGHCLQCNPQAIAHLFRYYKDASIYVAVSQNNKKIKVGYTNDLKTRESTLNNSSYAGYKDWKIIYVISCNNAGKIESAIQNKLASYYSPSEYLKEGKQVTCYELFSCSYKTVKKAIQEIKNEYPNELFRNEQEIKNAEIIFDFKDVESETVLRKGNIIRNEKITGKKSKGEELGPVRKSEFEKIADDTFELNDIRIENKEEVKEKQNGNQENDKPGQKYTKYIKLLFILFIIYLILGWIFIPLKIWLIILFSLLVGILVIKYVVRKKINKMKKDK